MDVATISMAPREAAERLRHYRKALHRRADSEYQAIALGYEALARGTPVLNLSDVFRAVPLDAKGRPRLAIARSDRTQVHFSQGWRSHRATFTSDNGSWSRRIRDGDVVVDMPGQREEMTNGYALVPIVPPTVRKGHADLSRYFTLWEVEQWADQRIRAAADRDPYLLQRLGGDLYAVVGEWDLTELERAVMGSRRLS